jgi:hypothetical protein
MGRITPIVDYIRRVLTEEVYKCLSKTFRPQTTVQLKDISSCDKGFMFPDSEGSGGGPRDEWANANPTRRIIHISVTGNT